MGHEISVVSPVPFAPYPLNRLRTKWRIYAAVPEQEEIEDVRVFHPRYLSFPGNHFFSMAGSLFSLSCRKIVRRLYTGLPFDLVHAHYGYPDGYLGVKIARDYHVPLVVTIQATDLDVTANLNQNCREQLRRVLTTADAIISPTDILARKLLEKFGFESTIIYYGIDMRETFRGISPLRKKYDKDLVIMSLCQLIPSKGVDINLQAVTQLLETRRDFIYIIVGDGPDRIRLETMSNSLGIREYVDFVGTVSHKMAMEYISICDIFTMPSWQETFGLVYVEAMAQGKPVIGCRDAGIGVLIERTKAGFSAEPKKVTSVVKSLKQLMDDKTLRSEMGENGHQFVIQNLTNEQTARRTLAVYENAYDRYKSGNRNGQQLQKEII
jgi:glycosyltransferase involved in cell wall biosynthesis